MDACTGADYENDVAADPRIDALRERMEVRENEGFTRDYYAPDKRYIGNAVQVFYKDGSCSDRVAVDFPIGHRKRREEGIPVLVNKFENSIRDRLTEGQFSSLTRLCADQDRLENTPVNEFMALLIQAG